MERKVLIGVDEKFTSIIIFTKEVFYTIWVSKEEAEVLRLKIKGVHITKTMRKSDRGKRYVEPTASVIKILKELRETDYIEV